MRQRHSAIIALGVLAFLSVGSATVALAQAADPNIKLTGGTTLRVDPICNAWAGATLPIVLHHTGTAAAPLALRVEPLEMGGVAASATIRVAPDGPAATLPTEVGANSTVSFKVEVKGSIAVGKWTASLYNGATLLATIDVVVPDEPLRLKIAGSDSATPTITVAPDRAFTLLLENPDPVGYDVDWNLRVGSTPPSPSAEQTRIPPGGTSALAIQPRAEWFTEAGLGPVTSLFKDGTSDGFLTVRLHSDSCTAAGAPMKLLRLKVNLAYHPDSTKALRSYLLLIAVLLAGAFASLYLNFRFPDQQIRRELNQQLGAIGGAIGSLPMRLASRLRTLAGVKQRLLRERLNALRWYSFDFESQRSQIATEADRLQRRVTLLERMGRLRDDFESLSSLDGPPSLLDRLENLFENIVRLLNVMHPPDADIQAAEMKLAEIQSALSSWTQPDAALAGQIAARLQSLNTDITRQGTPFAVLRAGLPPNCSTLLGQLAAPAPAAAQVLTDLASADRLAFRGKLLRDYAVLCDSRAPIGDSPLATRRNDLIADLLSDRWDALQRARRLVSEMSEETYGGDIRTEILAKRVNIDTDRTLTRVFDPVEFYLKFHRKKFETAAARDEWSCTWNFGHVALGVTNNPVNCLEEEGWSVTHYFPENGPYTVTVQFRHEKDGDLVNEKGEPVKVEFKVMLGGPADAKSAGFGYLLRVLRTLRLWSGENGSAVARLGLALAPAVLALVAGAREQLLKMDLFPALGAVFLAGFGSDQVKNLLSQKKD
jgi:hypothetical protein